MIRLKKNQRWTFPRYQAGLSLIELLVAMVIGLFLLAGIASSYVSSKNSSVKRDQVSLLEDNGRLVLEIISSAIEHTGYTPVNAGIMPSQFITTASDVVDDTCEDGTNNVMNTSIFRITADNSGSDALGVIYHGDNTIFTDCTGAQLSANCRLKPVPSTNNFSDAARIYNSFYVNSSTDRLLCAGSRSSTPQVIAEGVESVQFLYGVDTNGDNIVDRYTNASNIAGLWNNVVSIQIAVLVRSLKPVKSVAESKQFTLLDTSITSPSDRYQRAVFSTTVKLRNTL